MAWVSLGQQPLLLLCQHVLAKRPGSPESFYFVQTWKEEARFPLPPEGGSPHRAVSMALLTHKQVLDCLDKGQSLQGAEIGSIDFFNHEFKTPVNFIGATFKERVNFNNATFLSDADFTGSTFTEGVSFLGSRFYHRASFESCRFLACAYFWRTHFFADATFKDAVIEIVDKPCSPKLDPGEANFTFAMFHNSANFYRTRFFGNAYFWRTVFCDRVTFQEAKFENSVIFEGTQHEVRISKHDFVDRQIFEILQQWKLIELDPETTYDYAKFPGVTTLEELDQCLARGSGDGANALNQGQVAKVREVWLQLAKPMFASSDAEISFEYVLFKKESKFESTKLDRCLFLHTDLSDVKFTSVTWDEQRSFLSNRLAVRDERHAEEQRSYEFVQALYFQLKENYKKRGRFREAGDFHYGEMEMKRASQRSPWRYVSTATAYKYLSGYGEKHGLALFWLVILIFAIFPILFVLLGVTNSVGDAILHSLEVPAFLKSEPNSTVGSSVLVKVLETCERFVVYVLAILFTMAAKRRLQKAFERE